MNALRAAAVAVRGELRTRGWRGTALLLAALGAAAGWGSEAAAARGIFAYWIVPLAIALFLVHASLERASSARRGALDFERLYGGGSPCRVAARIAAHAAGLALALALALGALELSLLVRGEPGAPPRWTERPFADLAKKRLEKRGDATSLPSFVLRHGDELVLPLRWRGIREEQSPVEVLVLLREVGSPAVEEHSFRVSSSVPLRVRARSAGRFEALCMHRGGEGSVRIDVPLARIEGAFASQASAAAATLARLLVFAIALAALVAGLAAWLEPGLCLALAAVLLPWMLFDPLRLFGAALPLHPDAGAWLELGAWARRAPVPIDAASGVPFLVVALVGGVLAVLGEARRRIS